jgi:L-ascorbate metabolism protein UlaG (beta-lactamase superfamily)
MQHHPNEHIFVSRILHAGYLLESDGTQILFDPIFENPFSKNCFAFPEVRFDLDAIKKLKFSAVFISHFHDDHCSLESLDLLDRETQIYLYCVHEELFTWIQHLGFNKVYSLGIDRPISIGPFQVIPRRALDDEVDSIFHIKAHGLNILNVVDSWIAPETFQLLAMTAPWDLILWPFQTMRELEVITPYQSEPSDGTLPPEWIEQLQILKPRNLIPSSCQFRHESWSWYNQSFFPISYRQFKLQIELALPQTKVVRMNPSVSVLLTKQGIELSAPLPWIHTVGPQDVDYQYDPHLNPPSTAEIAQHFSALTPEQTEFVYHYCRSGLMEKYHQLPSPEQDYFKRPRLWRLSLLDQRGEGKPWFYLLEGSKITPLTQPIAPIEWTTDVPLAKLYSALNSGETLTSMYVRINDGPLPPKIKEELKSVDIIDDPLIRCLFNGVFGAYQWEQLRRLGRTP